MPDFDPTQLSTVDPRIQTSPGRRQRADGNLNDKMGDRQRAPDVAADTGPTTYNRLPATAEGPNTSVPAVIPRPPAGAGIEPTAGMRKRLMRMIATTRASRAALHSCADRHRELLEDVMKARQRVATLENEVARGLFVRTGRTVLDEGLERELAEAQQYLARAQEALGQAQHTERAAQAEHAAVQSTALAVGNALNLKGRRVHAGGSLSLNQIEEALIRG